MKRKDKIAKNTTTQFLFSFVLLLIFSAAFVYAVQDFDLSGEAELDVFQCTINKLSLTASNIGDEPVEFDVYASGKSAGWVSLPSDVVALSSGGEKNIPFELDVPCNAKLGRQSLTFIGSGVDAKKKLTLNLNVQKPVNLDIVPNIFLQNIYPCSPAVFNLSVENTGDFADSFSFALKPVDGADISPAEAILSAHEKKDVLVSFIPDDCSLFGEFPLVFSAVAEKTGVKAEIDLSLFIDSADVLTIANGVDRISTGYDISSAKIFVRNEGGGDASYGLSVEGPSWVKLDSLEALGRPSFIFLPPS